MTEAFIRNKPGMSSVKDMPLLQDGPPPGGFAPVRYARRIPSKGPSAVAIFLAAFGTFSWGMYEVGKGNKIRRAIKEEKFVKEWQKYLEEEARIMKDVPGWKVGESVYHSGKWMPPATGEMRPEVWRLEEPIYAYCSILERGPTALVASAACDEGLEGRYLKIVPDSSFLRKIVKIGFDNFVRDATNLVGHADIATTWCIDDAMMSGAGWNPSSTGKVNNLAALAPQQMSDDKFSQMLTQLESQPEISGGSGSGGCGDDEPGDDEDGYKNGEDEDYS
ncbi:NADH dehydrogenase [ubiquinone] 1 alpha subcomplex subunit 13-B [Tanacetum coccineum]